MYGSPGPLTVHHGVGSDFSTGVGGHRSSAVLKLRFEKRKLSRLQTGSLLQEFRRALQTKTPHLKLEAESRCHSPSCPYRR